VYWNSPGFFTKEELRLKYQDMKLKNILNRHFILCFFAQFAFVSVFAILVPAIPIYLSKFEAREAEIGFLVGILSFSSLILRPIVGNALLHTPEKKLMITGALFYVFSSIAYLWAPPFWPFLAVRIFQGIALALFNTAIFTLIANTTPETHRGQLISYFYLSGNISFAMGPYFGLVLINRYNFVILFLVCTGLSLCSLLITAKLGKREVIPVQKQPLKIRTVLSRGALPPSIIAFMLNIIWGALTAFFPLYALVHGVSNPGIFFVFLAVTLILGRTLGGKLLDIYDRKKVIIPCLSAIIIALAILTFSTTLSMFILVAVVLGTGWSLLYPSLMIYAIKYAGSDRGPAMGTFTGLADLGVCIGPMIMGIIIQRGSYPIMFFCLVLIAVTNLVYFHFAMGKEGRHVE
jgi:MFS family permease